jgi:hypothetical protein
MDRLNRDAVTAIALLLISSVFFWASFDIRQPDYGVLMPSTWPRIIIGVIMFLSLIYLIQSVKQGSDVADNVEVVDREPGIKGFLVYWRNPIICFVLFFGFLLSLPVLGMLIGGVTFVFVLMTALGGWKGRKPLVHLIVALATIGSMWCLFTYGLGVILPTGIIFNPFAL